MQSVGLLPGPVKSVATRVATSSRTFNLTVSNVPGPRVPLYAAGCEVESIFPVIPLADSHALAIGVLTYDSGLHIALHADPSSLAGVEGLAELTDHAFAELERAISAPGGRSRTPARSRGDQAARGGRPGAGSEGQLLLPG